MHIFNTLRGVVHRSMWLWVVMGLGVTACNTHTARMDFVNQNVSEDRLVGKEAVESADILNQYHHGYAPIEKEMAINIDLDRSHVLASGGELYAQIGVIAKPASSKAANVHVLIYDETADRETHQKFNQQFIGKIVEKISLSKGPISLTVDTAYQRPNWLKQPALVAGNFSSLEEFLKLIAQKNSASEVNHFILVLGDMNRPSKVMRQNMVDLASLIKTSGSKMSIVNIGEKPEFELLDAIVNRSAGRLSFNNEFFDAASWITEELQFIHASSYKEVQIKVVPMEGVELVEVLSPKNIQIVNNRIQTNIPVLMSGDELVLLAKLKIPAMKSEKQRGLLHVALDYFQPEQQRYKNIQQDAVYGYGLDRNDCIPYLHGRVARSKLILDTHKTIANTANVIKQGRNYQAIALLNEQGTRLINYTGTNEDRELARDLTILNKYASNLYAFQGESLQGMKTWWDMTWNRDRYQGDYR